MRTSKISRQTARVMSSLGSNATQTPRRSSPRSSTLQQFMHDAGSSSTSSTVTDASTTRTTASRKRKRDGTTIKVESSTTVTETTMQTPPTTPPPPSAAQRKRRTPAKIKRPPSGTLTSAQAPSHWAEMYNLVVQARRANPTAPVDTMGCERLADTSDPPVAQRFQTLVSLMLSSQTKDTVTAAAVRRMQRELPFGLNLQSILAVEPGVLNELIGKVGFHNVKTKNIKRVAEVLRDEWDGDIPDTIEGLVSLPGVGPKMGYLTLSAAWGRDEGIGVDVHVHRITNLWGWHRTRTPEETRASLEAWLPRDKWHEINHMLVGHGQTVCLPVGRKCGECVLGTRGLCPAAVGVKKVKKEGAKVEVKMEDGVGMNEEVEVKESIVVQETLSQTPIKTEIVDIEEVPNVVGEVLSSKRKSPRRATSNVGR